MSSKMKPVLIVVKIVIFVVACVFGYIFYQNYSESQKKIEELKKLNKVYNENKWTEAVEGFKGYIQKYPEKKTLVNNKISISLQNLANEKSIKGMAIPKKDSAKKHAVNREVITLLMEAKKYDDLNSMSMIILCDAYVECNELDKAKSVISEAKSRTDITKANFGVQEKRIEQLQKK